jgi:apolipoprotein D and lipocalin family protein
MQFVWLIKADYRIVYLDDDYSITVIGRNKRDYVWIMAREPQIPEARYQEIIDLVADMGYDTNEVQRVPQQW